MVEEVPPGPRKPQEGDAVRWRGATSDGLEYRGVVVYRHPGTDMIVVAIAGENAIDVDAGQVTVIDLAELDTRWWDTGVPVDRDHCEWIARVDVSTDGGVTWSRPHGAGWLGEQFPASTAEDALGEVLTEVRADPAEYVIPCSGGVPTASWRLKIWPASPTYLQPGGTYRYLETTEPTIVYTQIVEQSPTC